MMMVSFLIIPFLFVDDILMALSVTILNAVIVIFVFTFVLTYYFLHLYLNRKRSSLQETIC